MLSASEAFRGVVGVLCFYSLCVRATGVGPSIWSQICVVVFECFMFGLLLVLLLF